MGCIFTRRKTITMHNTRRLVKIPLPLPELSESDFSVCSIRDTEGIGVFSMMVEQNRTHELRKVLSFLEGKRL